MAKFQIRIDPSNQSSLARFAKKNMRSIVKEANFALANYYSELRALEAANMPAEPIHRMAKN